MIDLPPPQDTRLSRRRERGNSGQVYLVCVHESVGELNRHELADWMDDVSGDSYNAIADNDGLTYVVDRDNTAWHLRDANGRADGLCLTSPVEGYSPDEWLGPQRNKLDIAAWWIASCCADRRIDIIRCNHRNIRDALAGDRAAGGVISHADYTDATGDGTHQDPRGWDERVWGYVLSNAQRIAGYSDWETRNTARPASDPADDPPRPGLYQVAPGDTLGAIAGAHGIGVTALLAANPELTDPDLIYTGQLLTVPSVGGEIGRVYRATPGLAEALGDPITPETTCPDGVGRYTHFQRWGSIYWSPRTGAHAVGGAIRARWATLGWERSPLGYPTSHEFEAVPLGATAPQWRQSNFEHGHITWTPQGGAVAHYHTGRKQP